MLDEVEERLLGPLDVVEHDDQRRLLRSSSLRKAQAISSALVAGRVSPSSERIDAAAEGSSGSASSCFTTSTSGQ